jgi:hypothetical protein
MARTRDVMPALIPIVKGQTIHPEALDIIGYCFVKPLTLTIITFYLEFGYLYGKMII